MTSRRALSATVLVLALVAGACSKERSSSDPTTTTAVTTTSVAATTTSAASTTTTSSTSTTSSTTTSTTIAAVEGLELSATGLGDALFGADAEGVISYVNAILGTPETDTGWVDPSSVGAACPGSEVRFVAWADLSLFFSNDSLAASGLRHFAAYTYGPAFGALIDPYGLTTDAGVGIGDQVSRLQATYPSGVLSPGDELFPASFLVEEGLTAYLTDASPAGAVISFVGGFGCGE